MFFVLKNFWIALFFFLLYTLKKLNQSYCIYQKKFCLSIKKLWKILPYMPEIVEFQTMMNLELLFKSCSSYCETCLEHEGEWKEHGYKKQDFQRIYLLYAHHYNLQFLYFQLTFWRSKTLIPGVFFRKFCPYVWLVFMSCF